MVKFSKQLESQLVPEWKSAFCDYWQLKKDLKQIRLHPKKSISTPRPSISSSLSLNNLTRRKSTHKDVILVHLRRSVSSHADDIYETELVDPIVEVEVEKAFFARLDEQLNKVNRFYRRKEEEYFQRGQEIKQQLEKLITMRRILKVHQGYEADLDHILSREKPNTIQLKGESNSTKFDGSIDDLMAEKEISTVLEQDTIYSDIDSPSAALPVHTLELNIPKATPALTISAIIQMIWDDVFNQTKNSSSSWGHFSKLDKKKMQYADKMLRAAFVEFYRGLGLLKSFSSLNMVAFAKILKKYDKITGRDASGTYMKVVERAYFHSSDKVVKMMDELERKFTEHFTSGDHRKAMTFLRPIRQKSSHTVTFFLGLFTGCSIAFLVAFVVLVHLNGFDRRHGGKNIGRKLYMDSIFPIFSVLALVLLHLYMYGWNLYVWREKRINYAFIFEFATNSEIKYREVLLAATGLTTLVTGGLLVHFMAFTTLTLSFNSAIIPLSLVLAFLLLLFCPLNICYRSSRFFFLSCMKHIIFAPLYKVVMADFFLADQLTSQVFMFRNAEYVLCYNIAGHFKTQKNDICNSNNINYQVFAYLFSLLPYWWRLMQCLRRWIDEHDRVHLANGGKYLSAMLAAAMSLTYYNHRSQGWMAIFIIASTLATGYQLYWDLIVDWGLLRLNSKNFLLRDQLVLEKKNVYFFSMVLNLFLRLAWLQSLTRIEFFHLDRRILDLFFASLEVVRRGHWNFYRLENEHLNNVGRFRAIKTVPLPFRATENDV